MRRNRRRRTEAQIASSASQLMGLSLFIMLLAFFIVLNAISSFEERKVDPALTSIGEAFGTKINLNVGGAMMPAPSVRPDPAASIHEGDTLDRMEALFRAEIAGLDDADITINKSLGVMHVRLDYTDLRESILAVGQKKLEPGMSIPEFGFFMPTLVSMLKSAERDHPYRIDMIYNIKESPARLQAVNPDEMAGYRSKIGLLARRLGDAGMPDNLMSVGLAGDVSEGMVDVYLYPHKPYSPIDGPGKEGAPEEGGNPDDE